MALNLYLCIVTKNSTSCEIAVARCTVYLLDCYWCLPSWHHPMVSSSQVELPQISLALCMIPYGVRYLNDDVIFIVSSSRY